MQIIRQNDRSVVQHAMWHRTEYKLASRNVSFSLCFKITRTDGDEGRRLGAPNPETESDAYNFQGKQAFSIPFEMYLIGGVEGILLLVCKGDPA